MAKVTVTMPMWEYERLRKLEGGKAAIENARNSQQSYNNLLQDRMELMAQIEVLKADAEKWRRYTEGYAYLDTSELFKDAELGALVRKMPSGRSLKNDGGSMWVVQFQSRHYGVFPTPEEALRAELKETE